MSLDDILKRQRIDRLKKQRQERIDKLREEENLPLANKVQRARAKYYGSNRHLDWNFRLRKTELEMLLDIADKYVKLTEGSNERDK